MYIDDYLVYTNENDLWWNWDWNNESIFSIKYEFDPGYHIMEIFGAEDCCDGTNDIRFKKVGFGY